MESTISLENDTILSEEGTLVPDSSASGINNSDGRTIAEYTLSYSSNEIESGQRQPIRRSSPAFKRRSGANDRPSKPRKIPRYDENLASLENKIRKSDVSIAKLKAHAEKQTCPTSLRYNVRANITPDEEFKKDIAQIRKNAEENLIGALTRFHERQTERNRDKFKKAEQKKNEYRGKKTNNAELIKNRSIATKETKRSKTDENVVSLTEALTDRIRKMDEMMKSLEKSFNKTSESYACVHSDCKEQGVKLQKRKIRNKKHNERRKIMRFHILRKKTNSNKKHIKNLLNYTLTTAQINLLSRGLKFIPTPSIAENRIKQQLLQDFENFARRVRLQFIFQGQDNERHPFYVRSNWIPSVQPSVALETFLEEVKVELAGIKLSKPKHNLPYNERMAIRELKGNSEINIKKADKGTTTVIMNKQDKIGEGQEQLDNRTHYLLLDIPMAKSTQERVQRIIDTLYREKYIDDMTKKWLSQEEGITTVC